MGGVVPLGQLDNDSGRYYRGTHEWLYYTVLRLRAARQTKFLPREKRFREWLRRQDKQEEEARRMAHDTAERERLKKSARKKLTPTERQALDL